MNARRVLLIEDDPLSLKLMRDVLEAQGYAVTSTANGHDGLAAAFSDSPDLVVIDIGIPGIDGVEVTRRIKADPALAPTPVLAVSAYAMPRDERRIRDAGCDAFMTKPLRFSQFAEKVRRLIEATARVQSSNSGSEK